MQQLSSMITWKFSEAPKELKSLVNQGKMDWIALVPKSLAGRDLESSMVGVLTKKELPSGDMFYAGVYPTAKRLIA